MMFGEGCIHVQRSMSSYVTLAGKVIKESLGQDITTRKDRPEKAFRTEGILTGPGVKKHCQKYHLGIPSSLHYFHKLLGFANDFSQKYLRGCASGSLSELAPEHASR